MHGGNGKAANEKGVKELAKRRAVEAVQTYGLPEEIAPHDALLEELYRAAGHVAWLQQQIAVMESKDLYGPVGGGNGSYPSVQPHVWLRLYNDERKLLVGIAKTCIDVGIEERKVQIAQEQGALIATVLRGVLSDLGVLNRPETADIVRKHLTLVSGSGAI